MILRYHTAIRVLWSTSKVADLSPGITKANFSNASEITLLILCLTTHRQTLINRMPKRRCPQTFAGWFSFQISGAYLGEVVRNSLLFVLESEAPPLLYKKNTLESFHVRLIILKSSNSFRLLRFSIASDPRIVLRLLERSWRMFLIGLHQPKNTSH